MSIHACIFDLDGVLVDTAKYHFLAWKRLTDQLGIPFTEKDNERLKGVSRMDSLEIILEIGNRKLNPQQKTEYATLKNNWYIDYIGRMTPDEILPGCLEFINELKLADIRVVIGSSSKNTSMILQQVGIKELFDAIADGNIISKAKPDPEVFIKAANMVGCKPANCIVFEDALAGVEAALNAGMICVGIGSAKVLTKAHFVVSGLNEMTLEKLKALKKIADYE
jgi:beta-phosphoglucomutase